MKVRIFGSYKKKRHDENKNSIYKTKQEKQKIKHSMCRVQD